MPNGLFWSWIISIPTKRPHFTKPFQHQRPNGWPTSWKFITPQNMAVGSIWQKLNSAFSVASVWSGGLKPRKSCNERSKPGRIIVIPNPKQLIGASMWKMPDANSNDYTRHFKMDGGLASGSCPEIAFVE